MSTIDRPIDDPSPGSEAPSRTKEPSMNDHDCPVSPPRAAAPNADEVER